MLSFSATILISIIYIVLVTVKKTTRVLLTVKFDNEANEEVQKVLGLLKCVLKNRTRLKDKTELTMELRTKGDNTAFVCVLSAIDEVFSATLVEDTGDFGE